MCFCGASYFFWRINCLFKELLTNKAIRLASVRLLDEKGTQLGIISSDEANRIADYNGLDLVLISPSANPPVCKLMDYQKYKFNQIKQEKESKKNQKVIELKEIRLSPTIDVGDINVKSKKAREFLEEGNRVKLSIRMKGRQQAHPEIAIEVMNSFYNLVSDIGVSDKGAVHEGRNITMIIAPIPVKKTK